MEGTPFSNQAKLGENGWLPEDIEIRTFFTLTLVVGIPHARWGATPFVSYPFSYPIDVVRAVKVVEPEAEDKLHPIHKVLEWEKRLSEEPNLKKSHIAENEKLTRARVTQLFQLNELHEEAKHYLCDLRDPKSIRAFSLRKPAVIAKAPPEKQMDLFLELKNSNVSK